jgi:hypothetical protein
MQFAQPAFNQAHRLGAGPRAGVPIASLVLER